MLIPRSGTTICVKSGNFKIAGGADILFQGIIWYNPVFSISVAHLYITREQIILGTLYRHFGMWYWRNFIFRVLWSTKIARALDTNIFLYDYCLSMRKCGNALLPFANDINFNIVQAEEGFKRAYRLAFVQRTRTLWYNFIQT